jgi:hypothetical protein
MNHDDLTQSTSSELRNWSDLPPGYTIVIGPDGRRYLTPTVLLAVAELGLETERVKRRLGVDDINTPVCQLAL